MELDFWAAFAGLASDPKAQCLVTLWDHTCKAEATRVGSRSPYGVRDAATGLFTRHKITPVGPLSKVCWRPHLFKRSFGAWAAILRKHSLHP